MNEITSQAEQPYIDDLDAFYQSNGYEFLRVTNPHDAETCSLLVQEVFHDQGFFPSKDTPLKSEAADWDTTLFMARHHGEPIGTLRLIRSPLALPVDLFANFDWPPTVRRSRTAEFGRFVIKRTHRKSRSLVTFGLMKEAMKFSRENAVRWWIGCAPSMLLLGFQFYFPTLQILPQSEPLPEHLEYRVGREHYFDSNQVIRIFLIDIQEISAAELSAKILSHRATRDVA